MAAPELVTGLAQPASTMAWRNSASPATPRTKLPEVQAYSVEWGATLSSERALRATTLGLPHERARYMPSSRRRCGVRVKCSSTPSGR